MNPPFHDAARAQVSSDARRSLAHAAPPGALSAWAGTAAHLLRAGGTLTLIHRADALAEVDTTMSPGRCRTASHLVLSR